MILQPDGELDFERSLTHEEILAFRDETMWPAVDKIWNGPFLEEAVLGDEIKLQKRLNEPGNPATCFILKAECISVPISEDADMQLHCVSVAVEQEKPEQLKQLVASINEAYRGVGINGGLAEDIEEYTKPWLKREYYFDSDDEDPLRFDLELRLIDDDGAEVFDPTLDTDGCENDDENLEDTDEELCDDIFDSLTAEIPPTLTVSDTLIIKAALSVLGLLQNK